VRGQALELVLGVGGRRLGEWNSMCGVDFARDEQLVPAPVRLHDVGGQAPNPRQRTIGLIDREQPGIHGAIVRLETGLVKVVLGIGDWGFGIGN
jgi:hypothetical protein